MAAGPAPTPSMSGAKGSLRTLRWRSRTQAFLERVDGLELTMLRIPAGRFLMGSPQDELAREANEGPQHEVSLGEFLMGRTPITQAQWRVVASWKPRPAAGEIWGRDLNPEPSRFQGTEARLLEGEAHTDQRPVEQVSWHDAMEFCSRLSQRTRRHYTLPSEAQWENACRAGTTTPFHFGETITPELANYDGNFVYDKGPKGEYREQTTPVGSFPANAWGLQDMHGNVWEWCLDHWHDSYEGAPGDGSVWLKPEAGENASRLLRGGSWYDGPGICRSAYRYISVPGYSNHNVGFRVVCLPPGRSSPGEEEARVRINEVVLSGLESHPERALIEQIAYDAIQVAPGMPSTRSQLKDDLAAIYATGCFSDVRFEPVDTPGGVRLVVTLIPNPVLTRVQLDPPDVKIPETVVQETFAADYGHTLNLSTLQVRLEELQKWYSDQGYSLARVTGPSQVSPEGEVQLTVRQGVVDGVEVQFLNEGGSATDDRGEPYRGKTSLSVITQEISLKSGDIFNRRTLEEDLKRLYGTGQFRDVKVTLRPVADDPGRVVIVLGIVE